MNVGFFKFGVKRTSSPSPPSKYSESLTHIMELATNGMNAFEINDEINTNSLLSKYVTEDKHLILSNLLVDMSGAIFELNEKIATATASSSAKHLQLENTIEQLKKEIEELKKEINECKKDFTINANNMTVLREKYLKG